MEKKIQELNAAADPSVALQPEEGAVLTELFGMLSTNNAALLTAQHVSLVTTLISRWPASQVFPRKPPFTPPTHYYYHSPLNSDRSSAPGLG
jgi:PUL domain